MKRNRKNIIASVCLLIAFILWTTTVCFVDVRQIGPQGSSVGLAGINRFVHDLTGVQFLLYHILLTIIFNVLSISLADNS